ncbi:MAG: hypothetical protein QM626_04395 [Microbacterium sp.]|uniref:beta strand repeat-containing protein n=1 Tax=Microbacterium sp. TaxID=51671 RepID=UPI0039E4D78D
MQAPTASPIPPSLAARRRITTWCVAGALVAGSVFAFGPAASASTGETLTVTSAGVTIDENTSLTELVIEEGGTITIPSDKRLTILVNGVETAQKYYSAAKDVVTPSLVPGTYEGNIELVLTDAYDYSTQGTTFQLRQALYVGSDGVDVDRSVLDNIYGGTFSDTEADGVTIRSTGEGYNGIDVQDADYAINDATIDFVGNGRFDFAGAGAAIRAAGSGTVVVDGADIDTEGAVRTGIVAIDGSTLVVKNSDISTSDGVLPDDYVLSGGNMRSVPWTLGLTGNVRATNMLGANTRATYLNSSVSSTGWGVLSTDSTSNSYLTAINTTVTTGGHGYGSYADGQSVTDTFLGTTFDVDDYALISTGGTVVFGDSDQESVSALNSTASLGLTDDDIATVTEQPTTIDSDRFGVMWHGGGQTNINAGSVTVEGATSIHTGETVFQDKANQVAVNVDGSEGASLVSDSGVIFQLMESDDAGLGATSYTEPSTTATRSSYDVTTAQAKDAVVNLSDIDVDGDYYNAIVDTSKNLVLNLTDSTITGVASSSTAVHSQSTILPDEYELIGEVTNTVSPTVNNGVIVNLAGDSTWNVTGTSYLSSLTVGADATLQAANGQELSVTVDGVKTAIQPGVTYTGAIVVSPDTEADIDTTTAVSTRTLGATQYLAVKVTNDDSVAADITIDTAYGSKTFTGVQPGKSVSASFNSKLSSVPAGSVTVTASGTLDGTSVTTTTTTDYAAG